jgi:hypothetical protein
MYHSCSGNIVRFTALKFVCWISWGCTGCGTTSGVESDHSSQLNLVLTNHPWHCVRSHVCGPCAISILACVVKAPDQSFSSHLPLAGVDAAMLIKTCTAPVLELFASFFVWLTLLYRRVGNQCCVLIRSYIYCFAGSLGHIQRQYGQRNCTRAEPCAQKVRLVFRWHRQQVLWN